MTIFFPSGISSVWCGIFPATISKNFLLSFILVVLMWRFIINAILPSFSEGKIIVPKGKRVELLLLQFSPSGFGGFNVLCYSKKNNNSLKEISKKIAASLSTSSTAGIQKDAASALPFAAVAFPLVSIRGTCLHSLHQLSQ